MGVDKAIKATEEAIKPACARAAMTQYVTAKQELGLDNVAPKIAHNVGLKV